MRLYSVPFAMESALPPDELQTRLHAMVERRLLPKSRWFRLRPIRGWVLEERGGEFMLRTDDWSSRAFYAARLVGRIERSGDGSRIVGRISEHWLTATILIIWFLAVTVMITAWFVQHRPDLTGLNLEALKAVVLFAIMVSGGAGMIQVDLRMTARTIREGIAFGLKCQAS